MDECRQQKYTQHAPSMKMECDYLNGLIEKKKKKKKVTYAKISPKMVNPRDIAGKHRGGGERKSANNWQAESLNQLELGFCGR